MEESQRSQAGEGLSPDRRNQQPDRYPGVGEGPIEPRVTRPFINALSMIMSWRHVGAFRATVHSRTGNNPEKRYSLEANPRLLRYTLQDLDTGSVEQFDGEARARSFNGSTETVHPGEMTPEAVAARLAFPMSLLIWGRAIDNYRFTGAVTRSGDHTAIGIEHVRDKSLHGSLILDERRRMLTKLESAADYLSYEDISAI